MQPFRLQDSQTPGLWNDSGTLERLRDSGTTPGLWDPGTLGPRDSGATPGLWGDPGTLGRPRDSGTPGLWDPGTLGRPRDSGATPGLWDPGTLGPRDSGATPGLWGDPGTLGRPRDSGTPGLWGDPGTLGPRDPATLGRSISDPTMKTGGSWTAALKELLIFRVRHIGLTVAHRTLGSWDGAELDTMHGWSARQYQDRITQLKKWIIRGQRIGDLFVTKSRLLALDCSFIQEKIVTGLLSVNRDILTLLKSECEQQMWQLDTELTEAIGVLQEQSTGLAAFASYSSRLEQYNRLMPDLQQRLDYMLSLILVVRLQFQHHSTYQDTEEEQMIDLWNTFLQQCKEASEFTSIQRAMAIDGLEHSFGLLAAQVRTINSTVTSGPFLDPQQNGNTILQQLQELRVKFWSLADSLKELSTSRNIIRGESFDLSFLTMAETNINSRRELWNLFYTASQSIKDWKKTPFSQFNLKQALEEISEWLSMLDQLRGTLPADDAILRTTEQLVLEIKRFLPLLEILRRPEMQQRHWKAIFTGVVCSYGAAYLKEVRYHASVLIAQ
ncbi:dynein heavy chain domain-containing protein 1-like [Heptranchias perlo]|uniref:dynein heavy chain domain-containing protein 1-like n=1 Tax=Heptranchias perlo TaxID=212740 RepID=UPI00355A121D